VVVIRESWLQTQACCSVRVPSNGTPQTVRETLQLFESLQSGQSVGRAPGSDNCVLPRAVEWRVGHAWRDIQNCGRSARKEDTAWKTSA
jgi:hypothetical protein